MTNTLLEHVQHGLVFGNQASNSGGKPHSS